MADIEEPFRKALIEELQEHFSFEEEVDCKDKFGNRIRCDLIASPLDDRFSNLLIAFECKSPQAGWKYVEWSRAIKQASSYVGVMRSEMAEGASQESGGVAACFLFPAPLKVPCGEAKGDHELERQEYAEAVAGIFHLAGYFNVGRAGRTYLANDSRFSLLVGPNEVFNSRHGWTGNAEKILRGGLRIGSRNRR